MAELEALKQQLAELEKRLSDEEKKAAEAREETDEAKKELKKVMEEAKKAQPQVYVSHGRRLEIFKGRPVKPGDITVQDWIVDVNGQLALRPRTQKEAAAFIKDHLGGDARKEILGRGSEVGDNPQKIMAVLEKVFGDGDTLPQLQQRYFSYKQGPHEDLLACSLGLVTLYDRIASLDPTYQVCRESVLKSRLAEAVRDVGLKRELRRLNVESPSLSFFQLRDRAVEWLGNSGKSEGTVNEVVAPETSSLILDLLKKQADQMEQQQKQINALLQERTRAPRPRDRRCYTCNKPGHLARDCPQKASQAPKKDLNSNNPQ